MKWERSGYVIDTDRNRLDFGSMVPWIQSTYWAAGRSRQAIENSWSASAVVFGLYAEAGQIGCARVISDLAAMAYLADVFVLPEYRGQGLGMWLVETIMAHPDLSTAKWLLHTKDAHDLYRKVGFTEPGPRVMERRQDAG